MTFDIDAALAQLTLGEKAKLTAGEDMFSTPAVDRLGIPKVNLTDGPSGARGADLPGADAAPSTCVPCGSAVGATWDRAVAEAIGDLLGREALDRGCRGLLAPTVNLHRSPLAGRNFECYSEDPLLTGALAASFVRGVQANGVFATVKHFVGNEAEFERNTIDSVIDSRSLRELYLVPFEMAVREGGAMGIMTAYNRVNGRWVTEQRELLTEILRVEWGFQGLVMTDWFGVAATSTSLDAGLDLEMPGPGRSLGDTLVEAVGSGTLDEADLDAAVTRLLRSYERMGILGRPTPAKQPQPTADHDRTLLRRVAADATVLLCNDGVLPLDLATIDRLAVLGPNAATPCMVGGGSAGVLPARRPDIVEALRGAAGTATEIVHERGCEIGSSASLVGRHVLRAPDGFEIEVFDGLDLDGPVVDRRHLDELRMLVFGSMDGSLEGEGTWSCRVSGTVVPEEDGTFELQLAQAGRARMLVDGDVVLDGFTDPPPGGGSDFFGMISKGIGTQIAVTAGERIELAVEYAMIDAVLAGFRVDFRSTDPDALLDRAVEAAAGADVAVVVVGTNEDVETEGRDRSTMRLPGRQDELVRRVAAANPRTIVIVNAGAPVDLAWADEVAAVAQCWFGGQELDLGLADVLTGAAEPGGRLPTTIPSELEHNPAHGNFPGENGEVRYGEGIAVGYRGYEHRRIVPRFPFGHGLGYTTFKIGEPALSSPSFSPGGELTVAVEVANSGSRPGAEVIQCYVAPLEPRLTRPPKELKAFTKVRLDAGESTTVEFRLDDRAFACWDPGQPDWDEVMARTDGLGMFGPPLSERRSAGWHIDPGRYQLLIGRSSTDIAAIVDVEVEA